MSTPILRAAGVALTAGVAVIILGLPCARAHAGTSVEQRVPADPRGQVEIVNLAGLIDVSGWERAEVDVTGKTDDSVDRVDVHSDGARTSINVVRRAGVHSGGDVRLSIHVPAASALSATLVSSDLKVTGVRGDVRLQTVSGSLSGDVGGDLRASTVSGAIRMVAKEARRLEIKTISGDVQVGGGGGEIELTTVSGTAHLDLGELSRARLKTVSGDLVTKLSLAPDAQIDAESVSGDLSFEFPAQPGAQFDVRTFSGDIHNCFGPKPVTPRYGPGSRLTFDSGAGHGRVHVDTKSGDVRLCTP